MGFDPGYRTGCKVAVVDETGKVLDTNVVYCTLPNHDKDKAKKNSYGYDFKKQCKLNFNR